MTYRHLNTILLFVFFSAVAYGDNPDNQDTTVCTNTFSTVTTICTSSTQRFPHEIHTISFIGAGIGHVNSTAFKQVSIDFFISHLWEILSRCAVGIAGEYTTDINKASLASITGVIDLYPFRYGTTPYLGIETGVGYVQIPGKTDFGLTLSTETGVLAIKVSNLLIGISVRSTFFTIRISEERPVAVLLRVGILL
ncbi:MAG TPA: hypothetical protein VHO70_15820 [Chitinispirillaceae bacterium]|nr:hypothetical protein [Chitinispirillaceae bacterium]